LPYSFRAGSSVLGLILLMTVVPFVEIYLLLNIGKQIGAMNTFAIIIFTGFLGAWFLKRQGTAVMEEVQGQMAQNKMPADALIKGVFTLLGGVLLLTPGFVTDALGFSLVLPPTQALWRAFFGSRIKSGIASGNLHVYSANSRGPFRPGRPQDSGPQPNLRDDNVIDIIPKSKKDEKL